MEIEQFEFYKAKFNPKRTDDLKPGVKDMIGRVYIFEALYKNDNDEQYPGEWSFQVLNYNNFPEIPKGVVRFDERDLEFLEEENNNEVRIWKNKRTVEGI